jgi:hypothetical protein
MSSSLQDKVNQYSQQIQINTVVNRGNVNPPAFTIHDLQAMNDYVDKQFETDLGVGEPLTALCYPWEALPCVQNLSGFTAGSLSPTVDLGVVQTLRDEYQQLQCVLDTAQTMAGNHSYIGQGAAEDLENDKQALFEASGRIYNLTLAQICALTAASVKDYVVADKYATDLQQIANGRTHVTWSYGLDTSSWTPGGYVAEQTAVINPTTNATPQVLLQSEHNGEGQGQLGVIYQIVPSKSLNSPISSQVQLQAAFAFPSKGQLFTGNAIAPSQGPVTSKANFYDPSYGDYITVAFATAPAATPATV